MKIFVLLSRFPYPLEKGDKLRAYYQIKELSKKHEIHLCCLTDQPIKNEWKAEIAQFCKSVHIYKLNKLLIWWNTAKQFFSDKPYQVGYFYQSGINRKIQQNIQDIQPDHIYCQLIRTAEYVKNIHDIKKTIDYQDALSKGMFRRAEITSGIMKRIFMTEGKRLAEYENRIFDYFNNHSIISEQDKELISHPERDRIRVIENGIAEHFFEHTKNAAPKFDIIFTGNMNYPPNVECAEYVAMNILPLLPENTKVAFFGASPHARVEKLGGLKRVHVHGWIDDIRNAYANGKVFVAPLFIGTGMQNKLLEAMAMGIPCVTTDLVNNAICATPDEHLLIANTSEEFAEKIQSLLNDSALCDRLTSGAKQFVKENYSWERSVKTLEKLFNGPGPKQ